MDDNYKDVDIVEYRRSFHKLLKAQEDCDAHGSYEAIDRIINAVDIHDYVYSEAFKGIKFLIHRHKPRAIVTSFAVFDSK